MLLIVSHQSRAWDLRRALGDLGDLNIVVHAGLPRGRVFHDRHDLVAVDVATGAGPALAWAARAAAADPATPVLFLCEEHRSPEAAALRAVGVDPLVLGARARAWLAVAAPALVRVARARRALAQAETDVPARPPPLANIPQRPAPVPLPIAESRFRESYLRALLGAVGSRVRAAEQAGVPYRTLCRIVRDMQIHPAGDEDAGGPSAAGHTKKSTRKAAVAEPRSGGRAVRHSRGPTKTASH